ncbi:MAG: hypothetical protein LH603_04495 [Pseudonocardia sp.]|nr:hypothetical protein [Pseudonocardia sp.]
METAAAGGGEGTSLRDEHGLRAAHRAYAGELFRFALRQLGGRGAAEDIVQEVFLRAWRAAETFDDRRGTLRVPLEAIAVRAIDPAVRAQADVVAHLWGMEVKLTATGFRPGESYAVTVTDDAGRTVGAGEFIGTGDEEMRCNLNSSVPRADASAVTVTGPDRTGPDGRARRRGVTAVRSRC